MTDRSRRVWSSKAQLFEKGSVFQLTSICIMSCLECHVYFVYGKCHNELQSKVNDYDKTIDFDGQRIMYKGSDVALWYNMSTIFIVYVGKGLFFWETYWYLILRLAKQNSVSRDFYDPKAAQT